MSYASLVNAKLANARYLVNAMVEANGLEQRQLNNALVEAAAMQLAAAYRCFVRELAVTLKLTKPAACFDAASVWSQLHDKSVFSPEVDELLQLESAALTDTNTWLADLLYAAAHFTNPQPVAPPPKHSVKSHSAASSTSTANTGGGAITETLISVVQIDAVQINAAAPEKAVARPLPRVEQIGEALLKLSALIQRLRDTLAEY